MPSAYFKNLYFDTLVYDVETLDFLRRKVGAEHLMLGTDFPYVLGDWHVRRQSRSLALFGHGETNDSRRQREKAAETCGELKNRTFAVAGEFTECDLHLGLWMKSGVFWFSLPWEARVAMARKSFGDHMLCHYERSREDPKILHIRSWMTTRLLGDLRYNLWRNPELSW